ncbi:MAG: murein L,D-transpeptidase catalytic domain family protein [Flavobacteriales bacterium]|nr:murein L,D-transpeptidase catalytic domain family protein [Flavobacteriales bacterium]MCW8913922.1 murein L,D-transpeptidase catalytic domain family protein [Flavobacteriales bacterium]MCW8937278.1 murein L,D-transpeptidase catalytic domain family protein [Flavobacteriales bacterium]MCW8940904.1 murein L,D-transpeptidase catalytic domain family protein [Flavobacteriales bacterium]MCW8967206.1 murein L,D-transpeptidase catalytic domain family protein [Flavobacteriales bacterium]
MMNFRVFLMGVFLILFSSTNYTEPTASSIQLGIENKYEQLNDYSKKLYESLDKNLSKPAYKVFHNAIAGFFKLKASHHFENNLLTVIDFSLPSTQERMWIIDILEQKIIYQTLVAHGQKSGNLYANQFSNIPSSHQSSLGFYLTDKPYTGKHGTSLYLDGVEQGINDKARERAIVIHSADYVSYDFIQKHGRLGRSHGCPAIPKKNHEEIIRLLAGKSCLYIYHDTPEYHTKTYIKPDEESLTALINFLKE